MSAVPGERVTLTAVGTDPDGDELSYRWWRYFEADSYGFAAPQLEDQSMGMLLDRTAAVEDPGAYDTLALEGANDRQVSFVVPSDARTGDTIHLVAEVCDNGTPRLTRYQRVVVRVAAGV